MTGHSTATMLLYYSYDVENGVLHHFINYYKFLPLHQILFQSVVAHVAIVSVLATSSSPQRKPCHAT